MTKIIEKPDNQIATQKNYYEEPNFYYFYENEIKQLLVGIEHTNPFYSIIFQLLFETAARIEEARKIQYHNIDFSKNTVKIETLKQRGKKRFRLLQISDNLAKKILVHKLANSFQDKDYIFAKEPEKNSTTKMAINKRLKSFTKEFLGEDEHLQKKAHCHAIRHTRAIQLLEAGVNIRKLQYILGHQNIANTLIYLQYVNLDIRKSIVEANKSIGLY